MFYNYSMKVNGVNKHKVLQKILVWNFLIEESWGRHLIDQKERKDRQ